MNQYVVTGRSISVLGLLGCVVLLLSVSTSLLASSATARTANIDTQMPALQGTPASSSAEPLKIFTSIRPLAMLVDQLIPKNSSHFWKLDIMVPPQSSVHDFQLKPSDLVKLKKSDTFIWLGSKSEPGTLKMLSRFKARHLHFENSDIRWRKMDLKGHDHHGHGGGVDPHLWLSLPQIPTLLKQISVELTSLLSNETVLQKRGWTAQEVAAQKSAIQRRLLQALTEHQYISQKLGRLKSTWVSQKYITFHNGFGYLDDAFQIKSLGSFVNNPEDGISPRQIRHLQNVIADQEVGCLIVEPSADGRQVETLLDANIRAVDIDILGNALPGGLDWRGFWEYIAEQMQVCFGSPALEPEAEKVRELEVPRLPLERKEQRILDKL